MISTGLRPDSRTIKTHSARTSVEMDVPITSPNLGFSLWRRMFWRKSPAATTFQRCLAVHIHYASLQR
jgi:hypothetical protein